MKKGEISLRKEKIRVRVKISDSEKIIFKIN